MVQNRFDMTGTNDEHDAAGALEERIGSVGSNLSQAIDRLLLALPDMPTHPRDISRSLGVSKDLSSKLLIAIRQRDPLAAAHYMPGPEALRKVLHAASTRPVASDVVDQLSAAVQAFEDLMQSEAGSRDALDAMISAWLPEARARFEMINRQAASKAMANIKGLTMQTSMHTTLVHPSEQGDKHDVINIFGLVGLRRVRPGTPIRISTSMAGPGAEDQRALTIDGEPVDVHSADTLLAEFCSQPLPRIRTQKFGPFIYYFVESNRVGLGSAADLFFAEYASQFMDKFNPPPALRASFSAPVEIPTRQLVFDVFLHRDVWPGVEPELSIYDTALYGEVNINDRHRDIDQLDLLDSITPLDSGMTSCRVSSIPRYTYMLNHACQRRGWNPDAFRGYRCQTQYPVYGSQVIMAFDRRSPTSI